MDRWVDAWVGRSVGSWSCLRLLLEVMVISIMEVVTMIVAMFRDWNWWCRVKEKKKWKGRGEVLRRYRR